MESINQTMNRLRSEGYLEVTENQDTMFAYRFDYSYSNADNAPREEVNVLPALSKDALRSIILGAINGSISDMITVSSMYMSGFVLPQNTMLAQCWANFGLLEPASVTYEEAVAMVKEDYTSAVRKLRNGYAWPSFIEDRILDVLRKLRDMRPSSQLKEGGITYPDFNGIKLDLVYRVYKDDEGRYATHLYAGFVHENPDVVFTLGELRHLNIPKEIGMIRNRRTIPNYIPFGNGVKLYVVQGTLCIPKSKRKSLVENISGVRSLNDLWKAYKESVNTPRIDDFSHEKLLVRERINKLKKELNVCKKKSQRKTIKDNIELAEKEFKFAEKKAERKYNKTLPETYLDFVPTNILVYNNGKVMVPKLKLDAAKHLGSAGFRILNHPLVNLTGYLLTKPKKSELDNILERFKAAFSDYTISGLIIRPDADSVNIRKCFYHQGESK